MDSWKRPPEAPCSRACALRALRCGCGSGRRSAPYLRRHHAPLAFAPAQRPLWGRASLLRRDSPAARKGPAQTRSRVQRRHPAGRTEQAEERSLSGLPATVARPSRQEKFSRPGQACPLHPGGAGSAALGSAARNWVRGDVGKEIRLGGAGPHNLAPGQPGPPPWHRPRLPRLSPFLLPPPPLRPGRGAPWALGRTGPAGVSSERASARRRLPPPTALFAQLSDPGCARRAQGAGGGGARRRKRRARRGPSPERSPLQLQPRVPSLPPRKCGDGGGGGGGETPVLQRHSALLHRPPRAGGDSSGAVAAGSISAGSHGAEQAAGPASSRRSGMRGRAPRRPITTRRSQGPPRVGLPEPPAMRRPQTAFVTWEAALLKLRPRETLGHQQPSSAALSPHFLFTAQVSCP